MASIRDLKKTINEILGTIIEGVYVWEALTQQPDSQAGNAIIDEAVAVFNDLIAKVNDRNAADRNAHLRQVRRELEEKARILIEKLNTLD